MDKFVQRVGHIQNTIGNNSPLFESPAPSIVDLTVENAVYRRREAEPVNGDFRPSNQD